mmetsp:Transcript_14902/g.39185  ORF Transcript_14902/g.39185 Transcript_14902/m.39185 type:complete len:82 (+) Transcript_14902:162-407(+)
MPHPFRVPPAAVGVGPPMPRAGGTAPTGPPARLTADAYGVATGTGTGNAPALAFAPPVCTVRIVEPVAAAVAAAAVAAAEV